MALMLVAWMRELNGFFPSASPILLPDCNAADFHTVALKANVNISPLAHFNTAFDLDTRRIAHNGFCLASTCDSAAA
ncbi:hypothetical protein ACFSUK_17675 [Sphingobium scionense]|uniref:Uncharacterized protein n=2 Tax=Sphingomonadaceae TaxID=41297 RepID=A0ABV6CXD2_9SPHN|nr:MULTISPECIES: hypothetical protein [Sphingomonadaceae]MDV3480942.1 hypothetical protein [Sphingobium yanoikuyae]